MKNKTNEIKKILSNLKFDGVCDIMVYSINKKDSEDSISIKIIFDEDFKSKDQNHRNNIEKSINNNLKNLGVDFSLSEIVMKCKNEKGDV